MKRFILFLILISFSSVYSQWKLAANEPYNIAYSVMDNDGYVYVATNGNEFFRYSPIDSAWTLIQTNAAPEALYVNGSNELIRGMKEYSTDKGETWNPISFTKPENSSLSVKNYKNLFFLSFYEYSLEAWTRIISVDGGHTWEPFQNDGYAKYLLCSKGLIAEQNDSSGYNTYYLFPEPNGSKKIKLVDTAGIGFRQIGPHIGADSLGRLLFYEVSSGTRIYRLEDSVVTLTASAAPSSFTNIFDDIFISANRVYRFDYNDNGLGVFWEIYTWPSFQNEGQLISEIYNGETYNLTFEDNSYNIDLKAGTYIALNKGIPAGTITAMANDMEGNIYIGTQDKGVYKSENGIDFYFAQEYGFNPVEALFVADTIVYASYSFYGKTGSTLTWVNTPQIYGPWNMAHIKNYSVSGSSILLSTDKNGENNNYVEYSRDAINRYNLFFVPDSINVTALYTDTAKFAIAYDNNNVLITDETLKENGESTITPSALTSIVADQEGNLIGGSANGVLKLENPAPSGKLLKSAAVKEWTPAGLEGHKVNVLYNDKTDSAFVIYAGTDEGVFYSINNGASWQEYNSVSSKLAKQSAASNKVIGFSVLGGSVFANIDSTLYKAPRIGYSGIGINEEPNVTVTGFKLAQNYPNPFNPETNISFTLPKAGHVKLTVYNMLGQEVGQLVNMELGQGSYNYKFDGSKLSSGVYIYSLEAGAVIMARKMLLIK